MATMLRGMICMFGVEDKEVYEKKIEDLYIRVLDSDDLEVKNHGISMLINIYLERNEYEKAQQCIDNLPTVSYDKKQLQGNLYIKTGELDKAAELFEHKLAEAATDIFAILISMMEIALKDGRKDDAKYFAKVIEKTTELYDLWEYNGHVGYFQLYSAEKDVENFVPALKKMLEAMGKPWNPSKSKLYSHMKVKEVEEDFEQFVSNLYFIVLGIDISCLRLFLLLKIAYHKQDEIYKLCYDRFKVKGKNATFIRLGVK